MPLLGEDRPTESRAGDLFISFPARIREVTR
jgi:hypothetical protein